MHYKKLFYETWKVKIGLCGWTSTPLDAHVHHRVICVQGGVKHLGEPSNLNAVIDHHICGFYYGRDSMYALEDFLQVRVTSD